MMNNEHLPCSLERARNPFTCGISGRTFTALQQKERVDILKRSLSKELGFKVNEGTEWDKVVGIYAFNTVSETLLFSSYSCQLECAVGGRDSRSASGCGGDAL